MNELMSLLKEVKLLQVQMVDTLSKVVFHMIKKVDDKIEKLNNEQPFSETHVALVEFTNGCCYMLPLKSSTVSNIATPDYSKWCNNPLREEFSKFECKCIRIIPKLEEVQNL